MIKLISRREKKKKMQLLWTFLEVYHVKPSVSETESLILFYRSCWVCISCQGI